jgi:general secretion pathway protein K
MPTRARQEKGVVLVLVLWVIALLTVLAFSLAYGTRTQTKIYLNQYDGARARALADTGLSLAILGILNHTPETAWRLDGSPRELTYGDATIRVRAQNEAGKIDLNRGSTEVLANLFRTLGSDAGAAQVLAAAVADWKSHRRSRWNQQSDQATGALPIGEIQPFLAVEEFREVSGVTPEIYDRVSPFLTVLSGSERIDPLSAARDVLLSLPGADARQVDAYVTARAEVGPDIAALPALDGIGAYLASGTLAYVSISSEGRVQPRARFIRNATVSFLVGGAERFRFVTWQQGRSSDE